MLVSRPSDMGNKANYKKTLQLPKTTFPMRGNLVQMEVKQLAEWKKDRLYRSLQSSFTHKKKYILHDGPPYANGHIHIGHALNKILKDIIIKSRSMSGYATPYVPGWDCHGLPIEHHVLKALGHKKREMTKVQIRQRCREYAQKFVNIQKEEFIRLGIFGDWDSPYLTLTPEYEATIVREFGKVAATGGVYRGKKPVLWCAQDETALAEAEVEYADHVSPSIFVKFRVDDAKEKFASDSGKGIFFVIWTTTPWTLVANKAIALHPAIAYRLIETPMGDLIVAEERVDQCMNAFGLQPGSYRLKKSSWTGRDLEGIICRHPWLDQNAPIILGNHVTLEQGTGCVHTAPGHGQDDYEVGLKYGLEVYAPVDQHGRFTKEAGAFSEKKVFDANKDIISRLLSKDALLKQDEISHSYPHCWRCKKPVIFRATEQWFISMSHNSLRDRAIEAIENDVRWIPKWGKERIFGMIKTRPDWCVSRQRVWGVPIVAFICTQCHFPLLSQTVINHVADLMTREKEGSDIWFSKSTEDLLPEGTSCEKCNGETFEKEGDILDVWFESGVSHAAVLKERSELAWPADLYLEGSDQHRGWFHSTLLAALMTDGKAPYKAVLTHGFVVDGLGKKMSKSDGNVISPEEIIKQNGADILRLWVAATDFREDVRISPDILTQLIESYRRIRNTCRFLLGNLHDYNPETTSVPDNDLLEIDRWALDRLSRLNQKVQMAYRDSAFHLVVQSLTNFCAVDLSSFYLDILKDRLYTSFENAPERRAAQSVIQEIIATLIPLMAPILSFTAEELWKHLPEKLKTESSVHLSQFHSLNPPDGARLKRFDQLIQIREEVSRILEIARKDQKIGNPLEARVTLHAKAPLLQQLIQFQAFLPSLFIVSQVALHDWDASTPVKLDSDVWTYQQTLTDEGLSIQVSPARGLKCERCWTYQETVAKDDVHPGLCRRCVDVMILQNPIA
ncbi:MAG: isoleucine--tRNA ligase [Nitrospiria bacterium]